MINGQVQVSTGATICHQKGIYYPFFGNHIFPHIGTEMKSTITPFCVYTYSFSLPLVLKKNILSPPPKSEKRTPTAAKHTKSNIKYK